MVKAFIQLCLGTHITGNFKILQMDYFLNGFALDCERSPHAQSSDPFMQVAKGPGQGQPLCPFVQQLYCVAVGWAGPANLSLFLQLGW